MKHTMHPKMMERLGAYKARVAKRRSLERMVRALAMRWNKRAKLYHNAGEKSSDPLKAIAQTLRICADELRATAKKRPNH